MSAPSTSSEQRGVADRPSDRIGSWFFRLNGFAVIENFVLHPDEAGSQRTEFDIVGVRFHHRAEQLRSGTPMLDFHEFARVTDKIQIVFAEIKGGSKPCSLNRAWTDPESGNLERLLVALGPFPPEKAKRVAAGLHEDRRWQNNLYQVRLCALGSHRDYRLDPALQITWAEALEFIHARFVRYLEIKSDVKQWNETAKLLYRSAGEFRGDPRAFVNRWLHELGATETGR